MSEFTSKSDLLADSFLARGVLLGRIASGLIQDMESSLNHLRSSFMAELFSGNDSVPALTPLLTGYLGNFTAGLLSSFQTVVGSECDFTRDLFFRISNSTLVRFPLSFPVPTLFGLPIQDWSKKLCDDLVRNIVSEVGVSFATADFSIPRDFLLTIFQRTIAGFDALIRTYISRLQSFVIREFALVSFSEFQWSQLSVLDSATSDICRTYATALWTRYFSPVGHALPFLDGTPRHWNCRSIIVPILPGDERFGMSFDGWFSGLQPSRCITIFGTKEVLLYGRKLLNISQMVRQAGRPLRLSALEVSA